VTTATLLKNSPCATNTLSQPVDMARAKTGSHQMTSHSAATPNARLVEGTAPGS
jgi:hypothetical protein